MALPARIGASNAAAVACIRARAGSRVVGPVHRKRGGVRPDKLIILAVALVVEAQRRSRTACRCRRGLWPSERKAGSACCQPMIWSVRQVFVDEDRLVADGPEVARAQAPEFLEGLGRAAGAGHAGQRDLRGVAIPCVNGGAQGGDGVRARRRASTQRRHRARPARLRALEVVQRPEQREEPLVRGRFQGQQVRGVDDVHAMEAAAGAARIDVADAGEVERGHELAIVDPGAEQLGGRLEDLLARRVLDDANDGLDIGAEADEIGPDIGLGGQSAAERADGAEPAEEAHARRDLEEVTAGLPYICAISDLV